MQAQSSRILPLTSTLSPDLNPASRFLSECRSYTLPSAFKTQTPPSIACHCNFPMSVTTFLLHCCIAFSALDCEQLVTDSLIKVRVRDDRSTSTHTSQICASEA